jgi:hypothetical protein
MALNETLNNSKLTDKMPVLILASGNIVHNLGKLAALAHPSNEHYLPNFGFADCVTYTQLSLTVPIPCIITRFEHF